MEKNKPQSVDQKEIVKLLSKFAWESQEWSVIDASWFRKSKEFREDCELRTGWYQRSAFPSLPSISVCCQKISNKLNSTLWIQLSTFF